MKPIKFLEPEIAEKIEIATENFFDKNPISIISNLKFIFDNHQESIYFSDESADIVRNIMTNHPEQLLLHFATYDDNNERHAAFVTPISKNFDCITYIRKNKNFDPTAVASVLKRKDSDIEFDLTLVDTYTLDYNQCQQNPFIQSYLYGNPYEEDWQHVEKTNFSSIDDVIENNK
jgi:hypothetical protein